MRADEGVGKGGAETVVRQFIDVPKAYVLPTTPNNVKHV